MPDHDHDQSAAPATARDDPATDPRLVAAGAGLLAVAGAALALWSGTTEAQPLPSASGALAAAALATGVALVFLRAVRRPWTMNMAVALAVLCIASATATSDAGAVAVPVLYLPGVVYAAYFLSRSATVAVSVLAIGSFSVVAASGDVDAPAARVGFLAVAIIATAVMIRYLRERVFALIGALDRAARLDPLTGALNRLGLEEQLGEELERASRAGTECAVLIGDLDSFKALNDTYGHHAGDAALRATSALARERLRRLDTFARYGGDEFVAILPATGRAEAEHVAHDLATAIAASPLPHGGTARMSFGVATFPQDGTTMDDSCALPMTRSSRTRTVERQLVCDVAHRAQIRTYVHVGLPGADKARRRPAGLSCRESELSCCCA